MATLCSGGINWCGDYKIQIFAQPVKAQVGFGQAGTTFEYQCIVCHQIFQKYAAEVILFNQARQERGFSGSEIQ